ncbi:MAG: cytochrome c1 [Pseudomonadota bacterium]
MRVIKNSIAAALATIVFGALMPALAAEEAPTPPAQDWSFNGVFGTFDRASSQRGLQVYLDVCATCHSMDYLAYRNLVDLGFSEAEVEAIAQRYTVMDGPDDSGNMFERPGLPQDRFVAPFANEQAARAANNNAYPPDLTLIVDARAGGADYIYALLTGYHDAPDDVELGAGMNYNEYFPGHQIAMPNMLFDGAVQYTDGTESTLDQMAWDVTNFLAYASEPNLEYRKQTGVSVILFLLVFAGLLYAVKRKIWSRVH